MKTAAERQDSNHRAARMLVLLAGFLAVGGALPAAEESAPAEPTAAKKPTEEKKPAEEDKAAASVPQYSNWLDVSAGGVVVDGDKAQYRRRYNLPSTAFGGIEDFHWEHSVGKKGLFKIDGRGLFDNHDYSLKLEYSEPDKGFLRFGYKEFRTWYDASGGFLPQSGTSFSLDNRELFVDRSEVWFEGGLTLKNWPSMTFKYSHQTRNGTTDSTSWGDVSLTGSNNALDRRGVVPSLRDIDETRDVFEGKLRHTVRKTDLGLDLHYEMSDVNNTLSIHRRPGEPAADRYVTSRDGVDTDTFDVHGFTETRFSPKLLLTTGYAFTTLDSDLSGTRFYGAGYEMGYDPSTLGRRQFGDQGYTNLVGGSQMKEYVFNLNLMAAPWPDFTIVPSVRAEKQDLTSASQFTDTMDTLGGSLPVVASEADSDRGVVSVSERLDLRYAGVTNWVFYARADWAQEQGDLLETFTGRVLGSIVSDTGSFTRRTDFDRLTQKYTVGANWYPLRTLNFAWQYYHKMRDNDYDHSDVVRPPTVIPEYYPAFIDDQDFETDDVNFRVTLRLFNTLTLVSRYDFQLSTIDTLGDGLAQVQSAEMTTHIFGESLTWYPLARLYVQGGINYVIDQTDTPANDLTGSQAVLVQASKNNYWNANVAIGYALDDKTDLQAQYFYYRADDYSDNSSVSVPYGVGAEENGVTATLTRRISPRMRWTLRYGFFTNHDQTSGGHNDYNAHLLYSSIQYRF